MTTINVTDLDLSARPNIAMASWGNLVQINQANTTFPALTAVRTNLNAEGSVLATETTVYPKYATLVFVANASDLKPFQQTTLLTRAAALTSSAFVPTSGCTTHTFLLSSSDISTGGVVVIETTDARGNAFIVNTNTISSTANTAVQVSGTYSQLRCRVSSYTDGKFTVTMNNGG